MKTKCTAIGKLYIGIDIHKRSWKIHTCTELFDGKSITMPPNASTLKKYVDKHYSGYQVSCAYEAGCCGYSAHHQFLEYGWQSMVVNPADISRTGMSQYQKTDKIDARLISRELKDGRLTGITVPDREREQLRCLFRRRNDLVKEFRYIKSKLKSELLYMGIEVPQEYDNSNWSKAFVDWIESLSFEYEPMQETIKSQVDHYRYIHESIKSVSNILRAYCRKHFKKDYYLLRSVPGIGPIVACGILSEMGDLRRFRNARQISAYVGLIPGMSQSGDKTHRRGLNPRGNRIMRSYFVEASWQALRYDPVMQSYYRKHTGKDSKAILVKVAHKLLVRTLAVIKTETPYEIGIIE